MDRLVHDLLYLARTTDGVAPPRHDLLDLDDVVLEEVTRHAGYDGVEIVTAEVSAAPVTGTSTSSRRLVRNLLENAVRHARSVVRVRLGAADGAVRLEVADDGPGVPRKTGSASSTASSRCTRPARGRGSGLGLAIVSTIAERHGGSCMVRDSATGATFVLRLPVAAGRA